MPDSAFAIEDVVKESFFQLLNFYLVKMNGWINTSVGQVTLKM